MNKPEQDEQLDEWLGRHKGVLLKVARTFAPESNDRDDLFQEIVLQVWRSIPGYNGEVAETTWIHRVALYTAISWLRKETRRHDKKQELVHDQRVAEESVVDSRIEWLYEKISLLNPIDRSLTLLMLEGCSYREMATTLGMTESNVGVRINRIKKQLANQLRQEKNHEL